MQFEADEAVPSRTQCTVVYGHDFCDIATCVLLHLQDQPPLTQCPLFTTSLSFSSSPSTHLFLSFSLSLPPSLLPLPLPSLLSHSLTVYTVLHCIRVHSEVYKMIPLKRGHILQSGHYAWSHLHVHREVYTLPLKRGHLL